MMCPRCSQSAVLDAAYCHRCGHALRAGGGGEALPETPLPNVPWLEAAPLTELPGVGPPDGQAQPARGSGDGLILPPLAAVPSPAGAGPAGPRPSGDASSMGVVSLLFGVLAWVVFPFVGAVVAVVTGHLARGRIRRAGGVGEGGGFALAGLILGYVHLVTCVGFTALMVAAGLLGGAADASGSDDVRALLEQLGEERTEDAPTGPAGSPASDLAAEESGGGAAAAAAESAADGGELPPDARTAGALASPSGTPGADEGAPEGTTASDDLEGRSSVERLDLWRIRQGLERVQPALQACYEARLAEEPTLQGTVEVELAVSPQGHVASALLGHGTTLRDTGLARCVLGQLWPLRFEPRAPSSGDLTVQMPFVFKPADP